MKIWQDGYRTIYQDDARSMSEIPDNSIHCVVSSPPYYGLRKYHEVPDFIWGGDSLLICRHCYSIIAVGGELNEVHLVREGSATREKKKIKG